VSQSADSPNDTPPFFDSFIGENHLKPIENNGIRAALVGTALWITGVVCLFLARNWLKSTGREDWLWIAMAGAALGVLGQIYTRRRAAKVATQTWHTPG
jgi:hypothetical protein